MKLKVARVGSFRDWILVAGLGVVVPAVALVGGSKGLAKTGPAVGLAPAVAQQSSASQIDASPLMKRILSIAQAPRLRIIKELLAPLAPALAPSAPALISFAPVTITKDASPISGSAVLQGQVIAYSIQATNGASSDTTVGAGGFVRIVDTAPAGTLFTNVTVQQQPQFGSAWSCSILGGGTSIECHAGDGAGAGVDTFTTQEFVKIRAEVTVQPSAANGAILTNTATYQFDNEGGGLNASATSNSVFHVVNPPADLGITKVTSNATPTAGGAAFSYTLTVTNNGPSDAKDVLVTDPMPPSVIFQNVAVAGSGSFSCVGPPVGTNGTVTCTSGNLPAAGSATITIVAQIVANTASGVRTNTATVVSSTPETTPNVAPNTASVAQNIQVNAPLSITKAGPAAVCAGDTFTYHITVNNGGSSTALNATISDPLPANTTFLSLNGTGGFSTGCSQNGGTPGTVTCPAVNIPSGQSTLDVTVKLAPNAPSGPLSNTATITTAGTGTIAVGTSTTTATVNHCSDLDADLGISRTAIPVVDPDGAGPLAPVALPIVGPNVPPGSVNAGGYVRYDVPFGNAGNLDALNVMITDQLPANTAFVGALATGGVFVPAAQPPAVPFTYTVQAIDTVAPLGPNVNLICVVTGAAGSQTIYCRPQGNTGLGAPGPYADGTLPAGYNGTLTFFVKINESVAGGTLVSNPANISSGLCPNGVGPVPPPFPPIVCASTDDLNPGNNTTLPTETVVIASSNLTVSKIVQSAVTSASNPNQTGPIGPAAPPNGAGTTGTPVLPGTLLTYRITVTNNGPSEVSNIRLTDVLPSGLESPPGRVLGAKYVSVNQVLPSGATFVCAPPTGVNPQNNPQGNGGSVVCTAPLLSANAPNNVAAIDVTVFIDPQTRSSLVNTATFDATINNFSRPVSGSATLTTSLAPISDLSLTKTHTNASGVPGGIVTIGSDFEYQLTLTNNGKSAARAVSMIDTLPAFQALRQRTQSGGLVPDIVIETVPDGNGAPVFTCTPDANATTDPRATISHISCTAAELPPNRNADGTVNPAGTVTFRFRMRQSLLTPQPAPIPYQNCATSTSLSTDPLPANNTNVCDTVTINFVPDSPISLFVNNVTVSEGTGGSTNATFGVTLSASSTQTVTVDYVTSDITASAQGDYLAQTGTLTFAPGVTTRNIVVPVTADSIPEPTETFLVMLFNPDNAVITTGLGTGAINDDDASGVFQFSGAIATVTENASPVSIDIIVNRTGDISGVASVGYETGDITALQKMDYTFGSGTLNFAPGETSKAITLLIVNDSFVESSETFRVNLINASGNFVVVNPGFTTVTIIDDDVAPGPNPIDNASFFVRQHYLDFLGREPDSAGLTFWTTNITSCGADANCIAAKRTDTSAAFFLSIEFQETSGNVIRTQRVAFGRQSSEAASRVTYLQFMRDSRKIGTGVVIGQPGAEALLEANKQAYAEDIADSAAFTQRFPIAPAAPYVDALYASAGVVPTTAERDAAIAAFGAGGNAGRVAALRSVADSESLRTAELNQSFVLAQFYGYLRRNPTDAPDFNDVGYQFWLNKLNSFGGDYRAAEMVQSFILSTEYRGRFGTP